jgi:hypothetical protein
MCGRYRDGAAAIGVSVHWVFDAAFLPRGVSVAELGGHVVHGPEQAVLSENSVVVESDLSSQMRINAAEHREHR